MWKIHKKNCTDYRAKCLKKLSDDNANSVQLADEYNKLGILYHDQDNLEEALRCFEETVRIYKRPENFNLSMIGGNLANIALVLLDQEKIEEARAMLEKAERILVKMHGPMSATLIPIFGAYAGLDVDEGMLDKALERYNMVLEICRGDATKAVEVAGTKSKMSAIYFKMKEFDKSLEMCTTAVESARCINNGNLALGRALEALSSVQLKMCKPALARTSLEEALRYLREMTGKKSGEVMHALVNLANIYIAEGKFDEALKVHRKMFKYHKDSGNMKGMSHSTNDMGVTEMHKGNAAGALAKFEEAYEMKRVGGWENSVQMAFTCNNMVLAKEILTDFKGALLNAR
jgi:tetratricopeptide (TPR) repeat protein